MARSTRPAPAPLTAQRVLSLDISSVCVGWALHVDGKLKHYDNYLQRGKHHGERLVHFREWLIKALERWTPNQLVVEAPYAGRRRNAYGVLMMYAAVVLLVHYEVYGGELPDTSKIQPSVVKRLLGLPKPPKGRKRKGKLTDYDLRKKAMVDLINEL